MTTQSDGELVKLSLEGIHLEDKHEAFTLLIERYQGYVKKILQTYVLYDDVDDTTQEVFMKAWKSLLSLDEPDKFSGWLSTIAHHVAIDYLRQKKRRQRYTSEESDDRDIADEISVTGPEDDIINKDNADRFFDLLRESLKEKYYQCIVLHAYGFSSEEIAQRVDIAVKSVPVYLSTARKVARSVAKQME